VKQEHAAENREKNRRRAASYQAMMRRVLERYTEAADVL